MDSRFTHELCLSKQVPLKYTDMIWLLYPHEVAKPFLYVHMKNDSRQDTSRIAIALLDLSYRTSVLYMEFSRCTKFASCVNCTEKLMRICYSSTRAKSTCGVEYDSFRI